MPDDGGPPERILRLAHAAGISALARRRTATRAYQAILARERLRVWVPQGPQRSARARGGVRQASSSASYETRGAVFTIRLPPAPGAQRGLARRRCTQPSEPTVQRPGAQSDLGHRHHLHSHLRGVVVLGGGAGLIGLLDVELLVQMVG